MQRSPTYYLDDTAELLVDVRKVGMLDDRDQHTSNVHLKIKLKNNYMIEVTEN